MSTASRPPMPDRALVGTKYRSYKNATDKLAGWLASTVSLEIGHYTPSAPTHNGPAHGLTVAQFSQLTDLIVDHAPRIEVPLDIVNTAEKAYLFRRECAYLLQGVDTESDVRHQYVASVIGDVFKKLSCHCQASKQDLKQDSKRDSKPKVNIHLRQESSAVPFFQLLDIDSMESSEDELFERKAVIERRGKNKSRNRKKRMLKEKRKARERDKHAVLFDEEEDPYFVLMCLLSDLKSMRDYIRKVWLEYKEGKVDLITASLTTNATFDIIRTYESDFPAISSLLSDYSLAVKLILSRHLNDFDEGLALFFKPCTVLSEVNLNDITTVGKALSSISQVAELIFANAFYFLNGPRHVIVQRKRTGWGLRWPAKVEWIDMQTIDDNIDPFGKRDHKQRQGETPVELRLKEDVQILSHFARYVYKDKVKEFAFFTYDQFTLQWRNEFAATGEKTITVAQAFGAQIYLDIHHTLREDCGRGLFDLFQGALKIVTSITKWKDTASRAWIEIDPELQKADRILKKIHDSFAVALLNKMLEIMGCGDNLGALSRCDEGTIKKALRAFPLMELHPMMCGVLLFQGIHALRDEGTYFADSAASLYCAGQVYHSCQMQRNFWKSATDLDKKGAVFKRLINQRWKEPLGWKDMEYLFETMGMDLFFHGRLPRSTSDLVEFFGPLIGNNRLLNEEFWKRYKGREREGHYGPILTAPTQEENQSDPRYHFSKSFYTFQPILLTHRLYYSKYFFDEGETVYEWTLEMLQILLENHLRAKKGPIGSSGEDKSQKRGKSAVLLKDDKDGNVSQVTILRTLKEVLQSESRALHFDFLSLHVTCHHLLVQLREDTVQHILKSSKPVLAFVATDTHFVTALESIINNAELASHIGLGYATKSKSFMTNRAHTDIDASVENFLNETESKDRELKKLDAIWGIMPS